MTWTCCHLWRGHAVLGCCPPWAVHFFGLFNPNSTLWLRRLIRRVERCRAEGWYSYLADPPRPIRKWRLVMWLQRRNSWIETNMSRWGDTKACRVSSSLLLLLLLLYSDPWSSHLLVFQHLFDFILKIPALPKLYVLFCSLDSGSACLNTHVCVWPCCLECFWLEKNEKNTIDNDGELITFDPNQSTVVLWWIWVKPLIIWRP